MSLGKRLINTGAAAAACSTDSTDPFGDSSGLALYNLDYDASEASGYYDGTPTNVEFGVGGQINYGARFNGSSSIISIPQPTLSGGFTLSAWFRTTSSAFQSIITMGGSSAAAGLNIFTNSGYVITSFGNGSSEDYNTTTSSVTVNTGAWFHVVLSTSGLSSGSTVKLYINGQLDDSETSSVSINTTSYTSAFSIGGRNLSGSLSTYFNGDIDQVRVFSKALNQSEVDSLYAETACVYTSTTDIVNYPSGTTPVAYYKMDNSSEDYSTGGNDGTDTNIEYRFGRFGQAAVFNGSSSRIALPKLTGLTADVSVSGWVNLGNTTTSNRIRFIEINTDANGYAGTLSIFYKPSNGEWQARSGNGTSSNSNVLTHTYTLTQSTWYHVCFTRDDSTNVTKFYINGSLQDTETVSVSSSYPSGATGVIGDLNYSSGLNYNWLGEIDQVRIYDAALTPSQVTDLYNEKPEVDTSNFKAVLYEGTGATQYISNVGMDLETSGGLVWVKSRTNTNGHRLYDSVRGATKALSSEDTYAEYTESGLTSFEENGFFVGSHTGVNQDSQDFVAWCWKAGGDAVNIGVNSITGSTPSRASSVSANTAAGFSIVSLDKPNTNTDTYGHGLSSIVEMIILKRTASPNDDWYVYHKDLGNSVRISLNSDAAKVTGTGVWASTTPTASLFTLQNQTGGAHIAYCFHSVAGYSKIGSYGGGSSGSSNVIVTGFKPSFLMVKRTDQAGDAWQLFDIVRGGSDTFDNYLQANNIDIEASYSAREVNFTTNGFYWTNAESGTNISGGTYIYMAFK